MPEWIDLTQGDRGVCALLKAKIWGCQSPLELDLAIGLSWCCFLDGGGLDGPLNERCRLSFCPPPGQLPKMTEAAYKVTITLALVLSLLLDMQRGCLQTSPSSNGRADCNAKVRDAAHTAYKCTRPDPMENTCTLVETCMHSNTSWNIRNHIQIGFNFFRNVIIWNQKAPKLQNS